jgi:hypothetical protein
MPLVSSGFSFPFYILLYLFELQGVCQVVGKVRAISAFNDSPVFKHEGNILPNQKLPEALIFQGFQRVVYGKYIVSIVGVIWTLFRSASLVVATLFPYSFYMPTILHFGANIFALC